MGNVSSYEDLVVWQYGHAVTLEVFRWTDGFPKTELYGMVQQLRRAASSIPANIVEGFARRRPLDKARFYNIVGYGGDPGSLREKVKSTVKMLRRLTDVTLARARS
jgi:four helix bundle protein